MNKKLLGLLALTSSIALAKGFHGNYETSNNLTIGGYATYTKDNDSFAFAHGLDAEKPSVDTEHHVRLLFHDADFMVFGGAKTGMKRIEEDKPAANPSSSSDNSAAAEKISKIGFNTIHHYFGGRVDTKVGKGFSVALTGAYKSDEKEEKWFENAILKQTAVKGTNAELKYGYDKEKDYTGLLSAVVYGEHEGAKLNFGTVYRTKDFNTPFSLKSFGMVSKDFGLGKVDSKLIHEATHENINHYGKLEGEIKVSSDKLVDKLDAETLGKFVMKTVKATNEDGDREFSYGLENKAVYKGLDKLTLTGLVNYNGDVKFEKLNKTGDDNKSHIVNKLKLGYEVKYDSNLEFETKTYNLTKLDNKIKKEFDKISTWNFFDTKNMAKYKLSNGELRAVADFHNKTEILEEIGKHKNTFLLVTGLGESAKIKNFEHSLDVRLGFKAVDRIRKVEENQERVTPENYMVTAWTKNKASKNVNDKLKLSSEFNAHTYVLTNHKGNEASRDLAAILAETKAGLEYKTGKHTLNKDVTGRYLASVTGTYSTDNNSKLQSTKVDYLAQVKLDTKYTYDMSDDAKFMTSFNAEYRYNELEMSHTMADEKNKIQLSDKLHEAFTKFVEEAGRAKKDDIEATELFYKVKEFADKEGIEYSKDKIEGHKPGDATHALKLKYDLGFDLKYLEKKLTLTPKAELEVKMAGTNRDNFLDPKFEAKAILNLNYTW